MFPRKVWVNVNVYTDRCEFVFLLIPCFLLQEEYAKKEKLLSSTTEKFDNFYKEKKEMFLEHSRDLVSYIFGDSTIKFTLPYRLACSSTGGKPDYLHVHKNYTSFT